MQVDASLHSFNSTISSLSSPRISSYSLAYQDIQIPDMNLESWLGLLASLQTILFMFDYVYRVVATLKQVRKFWSKGIVTLPRIDLRPLQRKHRSSVLARATSVCVGCAEKMMLVVQVLPYVWFEVLVVIVFLALIIIAIKGNLFDYF